MSWNDRVGYQRLSWVSHAPRERVSWNNGLHLHRCSGDSHAPRERVSWNLQECRQSRPSYPSRSTWACELKYQRMLCIWNDRGSRSTWACELKWKFDCKTSWWTQVTLHVSVWVEIIIVTIGSIIRMSRSTWACELKWKICYQGRSWTSHAPRERVSWNPEICSQFSFFFKVTLHVSVWVEMLCAFIQFLTISRHAPRERVSWN